ncbi:hypothetical protein L6452_30968 [Arctium lappa]|uniref:Uncharacterized protein n=1 Tax=Arctium lappa TaxID=4217 RepID=A0ACB8ZKL9_ARCLA|nr:hypothetical protein L6452_30968 [Arctium lappa]
MVEVEPTLKPFVAPGPVFDLHRITKPITRLEPSDNDETVNMETKAELVKKRITRTKRISKRMRKGADQHQEETNAEHQE